MCFPGFGTWDMEPKPAERSNSAHCVPFFPRGRRNKALGGHPRRLVSCPVQGPDLDRPRRPRWRERHEPVSWLQLASWLPCCGVVLWLSWSRKTEHAEWHSSAVVPIEPPVTGSLATHIFVRYAWCFALRVSGLTFLRCYRHG